MIKIIHHIMYHIKEGTEFSEELFKIIDSMQKVNLKAEVQYQQSDNVLSALIIGRKQGG